MAASAEPQHQALPCPPDLSDLDPPLAAVYNFYHDKVRDDDLDLYEQVLSLERELAALEQREEEVRVEMAAVRREERCSEALLTFIQGATPLVMAHLDEVVDEDHAVVTIAAETSRSLYVGVLGTVDRGLLVPSANVLLPASSCWAIVGVLPADASLSEAAASFLLADEDKPSVTYDYIAGCEEQKREVREAVELPLAHPELFARLGVDPPRGVLLCGPPGTGKTMLARAVARHTSAAFFRVNGSELVSRLLGEGPRMVRDVFRLAREKAPSIVFIDEADAVAAARYDDASTAADREVQRVLVELLAQMDGFDGGGADDGVRVIMATNRADALDPALLRPGRLDRKVEFTLPDAQQKRLVFEACAAGMSLDGDVDLGELAARHDRMSAAEINAVCFEAGMRAVRGNRCVVTREDFDQGYHAVAKKTEGGGAYHEFSFYS